MPEERTANLHSCIERLSDDPIMIEWIKLYSAPSSFKAFADWTNPNVHALAIFERLFVHGRDDITGRWAVRLGAVSDIANIQFAGRVR
jgi:hypothetical protein